MPFRGYAQGHGKSRGPIDSTHREVGDFANGKVQGSVLTEEVGGGLWKVMVVKLVARKMSVGSVKLGGGSKYFLIFTPIWGKISILTNVFQMG